MKLSKIKVNVERIEQGAWVSNLPELEDIKVKVRGFRSAVYKQARSELTAALPANLRTDVAALEDVTNKAIVETVLLDWQGIEDDAGGPIPFSKETALSLLSDKACEAFKDGVIYAASIVGNSLAENVDIEKKA